MIKKRIGILTGGGDVPPLNTFISTVIERSKEKNIEVFGFLNGWQGLLENKKNKLSAMKVNPFIGGSILKSSRVNLRKFENATHIIEDVISKLGISELIIIGGEDTLSNSLLLKNIPQVLISKTIDNDVGIFNSKNIVNYFTLGYPTAAEKISSFVSLNEGLRTTAYSHERIIVVESMGMHAGWLGFSSAFGHPDFIILPEFPIDYDDLKEKIIEKYKKRKHLIIVVAEGSRWKSGEYLAADENERDSFGHPKFKGAAEILVQKLKQDLSPFFNTRNINSVNPSYLYRSGKPNKLDFSSAVKLANKAMQKISKNKVSEPVFLSLQYQNDNFTVGEYKVKDINNIEDFHRFVDERIFNPEKYSITPDGKKYLKNIIRELPLLSY